MGSIDVEHILGRLHPEVLFSKNWTPLASSVPEVELARLRTSPGYSLVRARYELPASWSDIMVMARPEAFSHPRRPEFDLFISECHVEKLIAPGDAICHMNLSLTSLLRRLAAHFPVHAAAFLARVIKGLDLVSLRFRLTFRRDFPCAGRCAVAFVPLHPETGELCDAVGFVRAWAFLLEPHPVDAGTVCLTQVEQLPLRVPDWLVSMQARVYHLQHNALWKFSESKEYREVIESLDYVVLSLRKCMKGHPLLPSGPISEKISVATPSDCWEQPSWENFTLAAYLTTFLRSLGVEDVQLYDRLDGRDLVWYQAAVLRGAWWRACAVLAEPLRLHGIAYRRMLGGRHAPELSEGRVPRFKHVQTSSANEHPDMVLPVFKTFVHFPETSLTSQRNLGAASTTEDLESARGGVDIVLGELG